MIICKDCGHRNQNQTTFCEACGTFLEWAGESVLTGVHPAIPAPDQTGQDPPPATVQPADPGRAPPSEVEVPPPAVDAPPPVPAPPSPPPLSAPEVPGPGSTGAAFQAQRLPVIAAPEVVQPGVEKPPQEVAAPVPTPPAETPPVETPPVEAPPMEQKAPPAAGPGTQVLRAMRMQRRAPPPPPVAPAGPPARAPGEELERRPPKPPPVESAPEQANPGDVYCSACGTPNDQTKHFCRRCGAPLAGPSIASVSPPARVPWWRRIFGRTAGQSTPPPAGTRPDGRGAGRSAIGAGQGAVNSVAHVARRFFQIVAVLGALGIAVVAIGPWRSHAQSTVRGWLNDGRGVLFPQYVKVTPTAITASSSLKDHPPQYAFDGIIESFWAESAHGDGAGQSITVTFAKPTDLARIGLTVGDQKSTQAFATRPVPHTLDLIFYNAAHAVVKRERITLEQSPKFQRRDADAKDVSRVVIRIRSTYPPVDTKRSSASIAEIELFKKQ